jgi:hypothetical protein
MSLLDRQRRERQAQTRVARLLGREPTGREVRSFTDADRLNGRSAALKDTIALTTQLGRLRDKMVELREQLRATRAGIERKNGHRKRAA